VGTYTPVTLAVPVTGEKADLLTLLTDRRALLKVTARNLTDEQARARSTVSELTIGSLIKHLATTMLTQSCSVPDRTVAARRSRGQSTAMASQARLPNCSAGRASAAQSSN
jgi:hypothetical protein